MSPAHPSLSDSSRNLTGISYPEINRLKLEWSLTRKLALGSLNFLWQIIRATIHSRDIQEGTKAWLLGHWAPFSGANFSILRLVLDSSSITNIMSEYGPLLARTGNAERMRRSRTNCQEDDGCHRKWRNPALGGYQDTLHVARRRAVFSARMMGRSSSTALIPFSGGKEDRWEILCWMEDCSLPTSENQIEPQSSKFLQNLEYENVPFQCFHKAPSTVLTVSPHSADQQKLNECNVVNKEKDALLEGFSRDTPLHAALGIEKRVKVKLEKGNGYRTYLRLRHSLSD
ncbi:hypothetical protein B0H11DRAFT_2197825 [Mycena galericulata]|nr:hypothetical protein B0H11DRAFT_2197825 [Mycena galericulata]